MFTLKEKKVLPKLDKKNKSRKEKNDNESPRSTNWKQIEFTEDHYAKPVIIDTKHMLFASGDMNPNVYKYDFIKNKLKVLFKYPEKLEPFQVTTCVNHNKQRIYCYCIYSNSKENVFMEYDLKTKSLVTFKDGLKDTGAFPTICCLSGNIHLIGGRLNSLHLIWNETSKKFTERFFRSKMLHGHGIIPLESTKQLFVFGGNDSHLWGGYLDEMWLCDTTPKIKWKQLPTNMPHKMYHFGYIKTKDESKVIVFGGKTKTGFRDEIWILNLQTWEWTLSDVKCPKKGKFHAIKSRDGYVHLFEIDTKHYWKAKLSLIMGTSRSMRSGSLSLGSDVSIEDHFVFDVDDDEKQVQPQPGDDKQEWEYKVIELHTENVKVKKQLKKAKEKVDALIQQNIKLNQDMRKMEEEHKREIEQLKDELMRYKNSTQ